MNGRVAVTGRRPESLPWGQNEYDSRAMSLKNRLKYRLSSLVERGYTIYYVGMARGIDTYVAEILLELRDSYEYHEIDIRAVIPFKGFADKWCKADRERYYDILARLDSVNVLADDYTNRAIFMRNKYMVDHADMVLAVYDNVKNGGTYNTLMYAESIGVDIVIEEVE